MTLILGEILRENSSLGKCILETFANISFIVIFKNFRCHCNRTTSVHTFHEFIIASVSCLKMRDQMSGISSL